MGGCTCEWLSAVGTEPARARSSQVGQCGQTCHTPAHMRAKSRGFSGLAWASAGHVRACLTPARSDRSDRAAAHTCILSRGAPRSSRMSAVVLSSRCTKSRSDRSRGGLQHLPNNFLSLRIDPSCKLARLRGGSSEGRSYRTSLVYRSSVHGAPRTAAMLGIRAHHMVHDCCVSICLGFAAARVWAG